MKETAPIIITFLALITTAIYLVDNGRGFGIIMSFPLQFVLPSAMLAAAIAGYAILRSING